jgi:tRNA (cytidine/uridine-2'-O-)-methyltransferase
MNIVLIEPEIAPNTGNIARLCAATGATLHLVEPLGFQLDDRELRRAGMDYWKQVTWCKWPDWDAFQAKVPSRAGLWFIESPGGQPYAHAAFDPDDYLVFGRESAGIPLRLLEKHPGRQLHIPMKNPAARSLNLSNCAAIVLYEALRQRGF